MEVKSADSSRKATYQAALAAMAGIQLYEYVEALAKASNPPVYFEFKRSHREQMSLLRRAYAVAADGQVWSIIMIEKTGSRRASSFVSVGA